mmetsp:Transcript_1906/g.4186  ORF Transcript_1906/g.4186 Transcript_1906/m.4186 type:complete len:502 (+) Transcript_1906:138-1643(+)
MLAIPVLLHTFITLLVHVPLAWAWGYRYVHQPAARSQRAIHHHLRSSDTTCRPSSSFSTVALDRSCVHVGLHLRTCCTCRMSVSSGRSTSSNTDSVSHLYVAKTTCTSLVSSHVLHTSNPTPHEYKWTLTPIDEVVEPTKQQDEGSGTLVATRALKTQIPADPLDSVFVLVCRVEVSESDVSRLLVSVERGDCSGTDISTSNDDYHLLLDVMSRILVQWVSMCSCSLKGSTCTIRIGDNHDFSVNISDLRSDNPWVLFDRYLGDTPVEMSEMVDRHGNKLGVVPRSLVHKLNILHRGVGIVVCKDAHISRSVPCTYPEVYVHQRTSTKRIFPSLYDMFVGGVSMAGEDAHLTAAREVAEELGLTGAVDSPTCDALSAPLFRCTICTEYNRCVVTVFTYRCNTSEEQIQWQEEEVQWGEFVPYNIVACAGSMSISRLIESGTWPGSDEEDKDVTGLNNTCMVSRDVSFGDDSWREWDFVPDGLLVWQAWLRWRKRVGSRQHK